MARILAQNLTKQFGGRPAVSSVSLQVEPGEIYGLVGPDGAGKTTFLRLLCGALTSSTGEVFLDGYSLQRDPEAARAQIGYLAQRFALYEDLTVMENLRFFAEVRGLAASQWLNRCLEILEFVGLGEFTARRAGHLSGGMKQKAGLAAALVHEPKILLLDEPTTGVDPVTRQDFWQLIIRLAAENQIAVLVSTPYMDEASRCHRVGFLREGRLVVEGAPAELRQRLDGRIAELMGAPLSALRQIALADPAVEDVQMFGDRLHLRLKAGSGEPALARLGAAAPPGVEISRLRLIPPQLEDVFIALAP